MQTDNSEAGEDRAVDVPANLAAVEGGAPGQSKPRTRRSRKGPESLDWWKHRAIHRGIKLDVKRNVLADILGIHEQTVYKYAKIPLPPRPGDE